MPLFAKSGSKSFKQLRVCSREVYANSTDSAQITSYPSAMANSNVFVRKRTKTVICYITCVEEIPFCLIVVVIATVSDGVICCELNVSRIGYCTVTPSIIMVLCLQYTACIVNRDNVALQVALIVEQLRCCVAVLKLNAYHSAFVVEIIVYIPCGVILGRG